MKMFRFLLFACFCGTSLSYAGVETRWRSSLVDLPQGLAVEVFGDPEARDTAIVFKGVRGGALTESQAIESKRALLEDGFRIVEIEYNASPSIGFPAICRDIEKLRSDILDGSFLSDLGLDQARVFVLPEGHVVKTDVLYFSGEGGSLFLDISYPLARSGQGGAPCVLEFSCDNRDRMGNYSLVACRDTLLEGLAFAGYATAMADHPVAAPYKGLDTMPDCGYKVKAAVRSLRTEGKSLGLSGSVGLVGFSRGSGMALLLATTQDRAYFEGAGEAVGVDSSIQAAVVLSGRFTYLNLLERDHMLPRYEKAWGSREDFPDAWRTQGALDYLREPTIPLFLSINSGEGPDAQHQMKLLRARLAALGSEYQYLEDGDGRGHKVPIDGEILSEIESYFSQQLFGDTKKPSID